MHLRVSNAWAFRYPRLRKPRSGRAIVLALTACLGGCGGDVSGVLVDRTVDPTVVLSRMSVATSRHSAFPSVARLANGDVLVTWREGKAHIDSPARIMMARYQYRDGVMERVESGEMFDSPHNEREAGLAQLADGTVVANVFSSREERELVPFVTVLRSHDGGRSWADSVTITADRLTDAEGRPFRWVASRSAVLELPSGRLLMPVYARVGDDWRHSSHVLRSDDGGLTWEFGATVARDPDGRVDYNETSLLLSSNRIVAVFRSEDGYLRQSESETDGRTWNPVKRLSVWGIPPHLLRLRSGTVLLVRGYRRDAMGVRYTVSRDGGRSWDGRVEGVLETGSESTDCGYPSSVELDDGSIFTAYYTTEGGITQVRATHYRITEEKVP